MEFCAIDTEKYNDILNKIYSDIEKSKELVICKDTRIDASEIVSYIKIITKNYSEVLGYSESDVLSAMERERKSIPSNYYNASIFPILDEKVKIFSTTSELFGSIKMNKFICPCCKQEQVNPYICESGFVDKEKECDLRKNSILKSLSTKSIKEYKKFRFTIKDTFLDKPMIDDCFLPVEFQNTIYDPYNYNIKPEGA